jgi:NADH-quinone oxidoreductase subunit E
MLSKTDHITVVQEVLNRYPGAGRDQLIPILQDVQEGDGFISEKAVRAIGRHLKVSANKIYGVATFYNQFRFHPVGRFHIQVCRGTACHVLGSLAVLNALTQALGIQPGQTTRDGLFSIEVVACIGACGLAPVISINGEFHAAMTQEKTEKLIKEYRKMGETHVQSN